MNVKIPAYQIMVVALMGAALSFTLSFLIASSVLEGGFEKNILYFVLIGALSTFGYTFVTVRNLKRKIARNITKAQK